MKWLSVRETLENSGISVFTDKEFRQLLGLSPSAAKFMLIRYTARGLLTRLRRGLYCIRDSSPSSFVLANRLYKPSYISMETALSYYHLIPESVHAVVSVSAKPTREFDVMGTAYIYRTIKRDSYRGYRMIKIGNENVLLAEKEKALADYLYFAFLKKGVLSERLNIKGINRKLLVQYIKAFNNPRFKEWFYHDLRIPNT
ncbi:type IV toxin-antitoxin system AbiEi family antitoxin domain-containing protein [Elusimicrobiota bacterium]